MKIDLTNVAKMINPIYYPAFKFRGRFLVLYGGSGSGKSYFAADKIIIRLMKEDKHNILCVRDTQSSVTKSQFPLLEGEIKRWGLTNQFKINRSKGSESITFIPNGNKVIFSGLDDVEKLKSIYDITSIWIEEANEVLPEDFRELNRRLRGYEGKNKDGTEKYMQIILSFNPVSELNWLKQRFFDDEKDTLIIYGTEQAKELNVDFSLKRTVYNEELKKMVDEYVINTFIIHSTYKDNKFIDDVYAKEMEELKKYDIDEYNVYALGLWGIPGGTFFSKENVNLRIKQRRDQKCLKRGYFEFELDVAEKIIEKTIKWVDDDQGYIKIYELPRAGFPYVAGGDTAGEGSDWNVGAFTNNITEADAAILRVNFDEDLYAEQMFCLGRYYNNALIGIETNFSTHPQKVLIKHGYYHLYVREETPDAYTGQLTKRYGFQTNKATRPLALGMLRTIVREHPERILDMDLLGEMTTFIKNEKGRAEAAIGHTDDCILARAINCFIRDQQSKEIEVTAISLPKNLPADLLRDLEDDPTALAHWMKENMV